MVFAASNSLGQGDEFTKPAPNGAGKAKAKAGTQRALCETATVELAEATRRYAAAGQGQGGHCIGFGRLRAFLS